MDNIFIFNNIYFDEFILNFKHNILYLRNNNSENLYYKFELLNKNELRVYWYGFEEVLYTEDSYLYFLDKEKIKIIKKVYLHHPEWNDQCIINYDTNRISRINIKNEKGSFEFNNDNLIINWDKWNYEVFEFFDEYSFYKLDYFKNIESFKNIEEINNLKNIPENNYIFIHICCLENWKEIFEDMIRNIIDSGLYNNTKKIFLGILGNFYVESYFIDNLLDNDKKFQILYIDENVFNYEILTINSIKEFCKDNSEEEEANILYIHTKGVRKAGNDDCTLSWRKMMEYHLIENYKNCLSYLGTYDVLGSNIINTFDIDDKIVSVNGSHNYHYSGNFWWSKKSYIKNNLSHIDIDLSETSILTRCKAENWICSNYPTAKLGIIFNDFTNTHPYHRYVFDYYKKIYFSVKPL